MKRSLRAAGPQSRLAALLMAFSLALPSLAAGVPSQPWVEVKAPSGRISVVTDAGEKAGRKVANQLAQFDRGLQRRFGWIRPDDALPLVVFASADEAMVRSMAPDTIDADKDNALASYLIAPTQHVGAIRTDLPEPGDKEKSPLRGFYRGRASYWIERALGKAAPSWLSRGLISFLADTVVREKEILVGRLGSGEETGALTPLPPASEFFREGRSIDRNSDLQAGLFIHYLLVGEGGRNAAALDALLQKVAARESSASSQAALAKVTAFYSGFPKYLASRKFPPLKLPLDPSLTSTAFSVRALPPADALMLRAEVLFDLNRPVDTRGVLRQAKEADPKLARPLEIEAILYEREQRSAEAKQAIETAILLGSKNGSLYYRLAQLQWSRTMTKAALQSVQKLLETARDLSPGDGGSLSYLAEVQGDMGLTQPALDHAQRGVAAQPGDVYAQMALARAQWNIRQTEAAVATAQKALPLARVASQKQRVQEFLAFATKNKRAQGSGTKPWAAQFGPPPSGVFGATTATGTSTATTGSGRVTLGTARTDSADASAITDCFALRNDAACSRAVPALEASCAEKQPTSCVSLGSLYDGGFGVTRDRRKAAVFYKAACDLGDKPGCARLAVLEAQGLGVPQNKGRATKALESLCGEKVPEACVGLAQILRQTGFATDRERARVLLKSACETGSAEACALLTTR